ncbi:unnamed protein product [Orchesella dallaii]|uniref:Elongation of very long chain fatty acids protein n=1 Tax=Orchesella dallaii TaxID=48710 RepID=A0ABP1R9T2_9HEXA
MEIISDSNWTRWNQPEFHPKFHQYWFERVDIDFWYDLSDTYLSSLLTLFITTYLGSIFYLHRYMQNRQPFSLRIPLFLWNSTIGALSIMALYRISMELSYMLSLPDGFYRSICLREGLHMSSAFWAVCMIILKPLFMIDTMFLILRKKPVDAVHVIHHTLAILFGALMVKISEPMLRWLGIANMFVHAVDYPLLALRSIKIRVPKSRQIMAALEIIQMIFCLVCTAYTLIVRASGTYCVRHSKSVLVTYIVYFGLLILLIATMLSPEYWRRGIKKVKEDMKTE